MSVMNTVFQKVMSCSLVEISATVYSITLQKAVLFKRLLFSFLGGGGMFHLKLFTAILIGNFTLVFSDYCQRTVMIMEGFH